MSLAIPLLVLFEGSIWSVRLVERRKAREDAEGSSDASAKPAE
jgi:Sec-independent protein secretion pathway component TatC